MVRNSQVLITFAVLGTFLVSACGKRTADGRGEEDLGDYFSSGSRLEGNARVFNLADFVIGPFAWDDLPVDQGIALTQGPSAKVMPQ